MDFPPYTVIRKGTEYDLRIFEAYTVVCMAYERRDEGYVGLGGYFDGANSAGARLRGSQPVVMRFSPQVLPLLCTFVLHAMHRFKLAMRLAYCSHTGHCLGRAARAWSCMWARGRTDGSLKR